MKKIILAAIAIMALAIPSANAQSVLDLFGNGSSNSSSTAGNVLGNLIEGVFTKTDITVADIAGSYTSSGPAVTFKSENFLQKAGGLAAAGVIEGKLAPYYKKYGLDNLTLTINNDETFTMQAKALRLSGKIVRDAANGTFEFQFSAFGKIKLGSLTAYIEKTGSNINLMFDATKLKNFMSSLTKYFSSSMIKAAGNILDKYEGLCVGFKMQRTGNATDAPATTTGSSTSTKRQGNSNSSFGEGLDLLRNALGGKK